MSDLYFLLTVAAITAAIVLLPASVLWTAAWVALILWMLR